MLSAKLDIIDVLWEPRQKELPTQIALRRFSRSNV